LKMTTRSISAGDSRLVDEGKMPNKSLQLSAWVQPVMEERNPLNRRIAF
jgi:hypothetical protein